MLKFMIFINFYARKTVSSDLHQGKLKSRILRKTPKLIKYHIKSRLGCAKTDLQHENDYFKKKRWSDESEIEVIRYNDAILVWREYGEAYSQQNTIPTMKHCDGNIMAWGCLAYSGTEKLRIIDSTMKSAKYILVGLRKAFVWGNLDIRCI